MHNTEGNPARLDSEPVNALHSRLRFEHGRIFVPDIMHPAQPWTQFLDPFDQAVIPSIRGEVGAEESVRVRHSAAGLGLVQLAAVM